MESRIRIGTLVATHGLQGHLVLTHELGKRSEFPDVEVFFIEMQGKELLPYFIQEIKAKNEKDVHVLFEGVTTPEKARLLLKKGVWLPESDARRLAARNAPLSMLDYHVVDSGRDLGPVLEVIEQPLQILLRLEMQGREVLIPLNESTLKFIDHSKRVIDVELPDGLLDVYLSR